ncbi:hypothetical protein [Nesterenkonia natronophila]|uniref:Uncharacterized protein n=1 Tax=Nesterenkonia natronophila TaxID=2174932 RepID=A0A3A4FBD7_9MICC|nr:hypothetical protein [Nesterenkonia natronophila]RJN32427.1 hypothetical protein D3250_00825 [Nesterenkonia natronophila]
MSRNQKPTRTHTPKRPRRTTPANQAPRSRRQPATNHTLLAARYLWAVTTGLVIAALLFEPTMVWTIGVGVFMIANLEWLGLWLIVAGYGMSCLPVTFGLLVATGRFWFSLTHGLWTGAVYSVAGFLLLEQILGVLAPYGLH